MFAATRGSSLRLDRRLRRRRDDKRGATIKSVRAATPPDPRGPRAGPPPAWTATPRGSLHDSKALRVPALWRGPWPVERRGWPASRPCVRPESGKAIIAAAARRGIIQDVRLQGWNPELTQKL